MQFALELLEFFLFHPDAVGRRWEFAVDDIFVVCGKGGREDFVHICVDLERLGRMARLVSEHVVQHDNRAIAVRPGDAADHGQVGPARNHAGHLQGDGLQ